MNCNLNIHTGNTNIDYQLSDFDFELPTELIAKYPLKSRSSSRLLCMNRANQSVQHRSFIDIVDCVKPEDLLIFNDTKVIPARLYGVKMSGGKVECLLERILSADQALAHVRANRTLALGSKLKLQDAIEVTVEGREGDLYQLRFHDTKTILELLDNYGHMPLPPYIDRNSETVDDERYQTIFAAKSGAVAAPTAGLHFDQTVFDQLAQKGVSTSFITLHVGAGTFQPVRANSLDEHSMHSEWMELSQATCQAIAECRARGGRVVAIGTTVARCLETAAANITPTNELKPWQGETQIFIRPGFQFRCIDALLTNFHLPKSTLLMLVAAFAGYDLTMHAYQVAIQQRYRFYSYGDAMLIS